MSLSSLVACRLTPIQARDLWEHFDEASAFTRPDHLARLVDEVEWSGVDRSGEIVAAWPLVRAVAGDRINTSSTAADSAVLLCAPCLQQTSATPKKIHSGLAASHR